MFSHGLLFQNLRWRLMRNSLALLMVNSWLRIYTIGVCCLFIWLFLFSLSWYGFHELKTRWSIRIDDILIERVFEWFFLTLTMLLIFSTGLILYSALFAGPESEALLSSPIPDDHIFAYKFQGAVAFSSWAFVLLGSPVLLAYGIEVRTGAPWYFYAVLPVFFLGFMLIPGSLGALACLIIVNLLPRRRRQILIGIGIILLAAGAVWLFLWFRQVRDLGVGSRAWFESLINSMDWLGSRLVPFNWIARGIKAAALGQVGVMGYCLALVWSNGLFLYLVTVWLAKKLYRRGYNRIASGGTLRKRYHGHWLDNLLLGKFLFFLDTQTQLLIIKDFRTFRRDPAQWAQLLIFMGLGCIYFLYLRRFYEQDLDRSFKNGISLLTLIATSFLMCAYTGRFIFPMLSLEGKKFWILGLLPLDRGRLMIGKFVFSSLGCVGTGEFLILCGNLMLGMPWLIIVVHMLTIGVLALGFSGLSVGLGACMPNFREHDPSRIAVGFGGTVNLIVGLLLLATVISLVVVPVQFTYGRHDAEGSLSLTMVPTLAWLAMIVGLALGSAAIWLPMRAGMRCLREMEF